VILLTFKPLWAQRDKTPFKVIECLAKEELYYHKKKELGPGYKLNQFFINEIASNSSISLKSQYREEICKDSRKVSLRLLSYLLVERDRIFEKTTGYDQAFSFIHNLEESLPKIFFHFITEIQALAKDPHCLDKHVPYLVELKDRFKYLEGEIGENSLLAQKTKVFKAFTALEDYRGLIKRCENYQDPRLKKKKSK
jgi:hypothetical protein